MDCEKHIKRFEDYVIDVLGTGGGCQFKQQGSILEIHGLKYDLFKLFQLSIIWRASITALPFFKNVALGPHEEKLRELILHSDAGEPGDYPCMMVGIYFKEPSYQGAADFIGEPEKLRFAGGHRVYRLEFASCMWIYVVSKHFDITTIAGGQFVIQQNGILKILARDVRDVKFLNKYFSLISAKN